MIPNNNIKWLLAALVVAVTIPTSGAQSEEVALTAAQDEEPQDPMLKATAVVWADPSLPPAGFEKTQQALMTVANQLAPIMDLELPEPLLAAKRRVVAWLSVCELKRPRCSSVIADIDKKLSDDVERDNVNVRAYLDICRQVQTLYCGNTRAASEEKAQMYAWEDVRRKNKEEFGRARGNLFEKMLQVCWPKCERN